MILFSRCRRLKIAPSTLTGGRSDIKNGSRCEGTLLVTDLLRSLLPGKFLDEPYVFIMKYLLNKLSSYDVSQSSDPQSI